MAWKHPPTDDHHSLPDKGGKAFCSARCFASARVLQQPSLSCSEGPKLGPIYVLSTPKHIVCTCELGSKLFVSSLVALHNLKGLNPKQCEFDPVQGDLEPAMEVLMTLRERIPCILCIIRLYGVLTMAHAASLGCSCPFPSLECPRLLRLYLQSHPVQAE